MAVRTKELGTAKNPGAGVLATVYTCPAGKTAIIKEYLVQASGSVSFQSVIARGATNYTFAIHTVTTTTFLRVPCWTVLEPGDILKVVWTTANASHSFWMSGTELDGVA